MSPKWRCIIFYLASLSNYIAALFALLEGNSSAGTIFLLTGACFLCLGSVTLLKNRQDTSEKKKD